MYTAFRTGERRRGWLPSAADDDWPELSQPAPQLVRLELQDVLSALARLPDPQRAAISLIALEDFSYREAARILDVPMGTLTSRLARGREALRQIMAGEAEARPALRVIEGKR